MQFRRAAIIGLVLLLTAAFCSGIRAEDQNRGPETLIINGGRRGNVRLPHRQHQQRLKDCRICHRFFPQKVGSIEKLKAAGKLEKKQVMKHLCIHCHRKRKKAGRPAGPVSCRTCHKRK